MKYEGMVYRPPSEARSLIIQITIGCRHNQCTFCSMYKDKVFRVRSREPITSGLAKQAGNEIEHPTGFVSNKQSFIEEEIYKDLEEMGLMYAHLPLRIFLADGDALTLDTKQLIEILGWIYQLFPLCQRVTIYGTAGDVLKKSVPELMTLKDAGLSMVYMGAESGSDEILRHIRKGLSAEQMVLAGEMLKEAGIDLSLTLISGLGGRKKLREHAFLSADLVSRIRPEYLGFLTLMLEGDTPMRREIESGEMELLRPGEVMEEMKLFLDDVDSEGTVFRTTHASNYLTLRGNLNQDIRKMVLQIEQAMKQQSFRPESLRGL